VDLAVDLRRRVAGLVWGTVEGTELTASDRKLLGDGLGGIVLFSRNVASPPQLVELTAAIREAASNPVVIAIDQEGGHIVRIGEPLTRLPSPMAVGATGDARLARAAARASAVELAACGIDVVLAPVLDVAAERRAVVVGARAYGDDPRLVARLGAAAIRGYLEGGVLPMAKHFPGHGRTAVDSHLGLPVIADDPTGLTAIDLVPFQAALAAGVPALMTAHVVHADLDAVRPASLSAATSRLARERLGFDGLLVTDAIVMDAVARRQPIEDAARDALLAGADVVMALEAAHRVVDRLVRDVESGVIDEADLAEPARRSATFAAKARAVAAGRAGSLDPVAALPHRRISQRAARRALTLVSGTARLPIRSSESVAVVDLRSLRPSPVEDAVGSGRDAGALLAEALGAVLLALDPTDDAAAIAAGRAAAAGDRVVLLTRDAFADPRSCALARLVAGPSTVHVALRNPVDLELAPSGVQIATYHESPAVGAALAVALAVGAGAFPGRLPVALELPGDEELARDMAS
jgi:beta-N-acetylhexosaminidase